MNRRQFTRAAMLAPIGFTLRSAAESQTSSPSAQTSTLKPAIAGPHKHKTAAEYNRHPPIYEPEPFAGDLAFESRQSGILLGIIFPLARIYMNASRAQRCLSHFQQLCGLPDRHLPDFLIHLLPVIPF